MGIGNFNSSKRLVWAGCLRESGPAVLNLVNEFGQEIRMKQRIDRHKDGSNQGQGPRPRRGAGGILGVVQKRRHQNALRIF